MANAIYWRCRSALTIIELLVIVASVVLLAVLVVPRFAADVDNRVLLTQAVIEGSADCFERFKRHCERYPHQLSELMERPTDAEVSDKWQGPYLKRPLVDGWGTAIEYAFPGRHNPNTYDIWSCGPDHVSGTGDDITNWE